MFSALSGLISRTFNTEASTHQAINQSTLDRDANRHHDALGSVFAAPIPARDHSLPEVPPLKQHPELRFQRLEQFSKALELGRSEGLGFQDGRIVDLRNLDPSKEVIIVGDLHGRLDNLQRILQQDNNGQKIMRGDAVLIILGDVVHDERKSKVMESASSIQLMEWLMELKIARPDSVYITLGNHDPLNTDVKKHEFYQALGYRNALQGLFDSPKQGKAYTKAYSACLEQWPLMVNGAGYVAVHAGPVGGHSLEQIRNARVQDSSTSAQGSVQLQATWSRWQEFNEPGIKYGPREVLSFLDICGQPRGAVLLVGHSPRPYEQERWMWQLMTNHFIIIGSHEAVGYASVQNGQMHFRNVHASADQVPKLRAA